MSRPPWRRPRRRPRSADDFTPVRISTSEPTEAVKQIPLFYIDDQEYTVPAKLPPALGLRYLRDVRDRGSDYATAELLIAALGEEGFDALSECDAIDADQMDSIIEGVIGIAMGAVDPGKGSNSAPSS